MRFELTTYTMRTYRSSQLSYCPVKSYPVIYIHIQKNQMLFLIFHKIFTIKPSQFLISIKKTLYYS